MNAVLASLEDDGHGALSFRGARYLLVRPETLVALQRAVEAALGPRAADCLVAGGRAGGGSALGMLAGPVEERVARLLGMGREIGWGEFTLERLAPGELVVTVANSPIARAYGAATGPVCHLVRGVLERLAEVVFGRAAVAEETECAAAGGRACRFEARPA